MRKVNLLIVAFFILLTLGVTVSGCSSGADTKEIILATTTSTYDSGLLDVLIPLFQQKTGYTVKTVPVGTGKALAMGERGDADVLLVHAPEAERPLVEKGVVINYRRVMHNDFVIVGPPEDPAGVKGSGSAAEAFKKIADSEALFLSRGDSSGTHKKELGIWEQAGLKPQGNKWYQETGTGMGNTLNVASEKEGYTLTDRGTYLKLKKHLRLEIVFEGDPVLMNIYHVMQVNPEKFPGTNEEGGRALVDFLVGPEAQEVIGEYGVKEFGQPLFYPDARKGRE
ncbi:substrate-binding domain-containing protein [Calderihabitans maritimus]|uniref:PBP domain-containing protein n=1 Tax=Calderihabitans maritimus TaxID=1246530 RepID=A0A1Z5HV14_9FIRM|nr:substrate-binding domain-containing protein [Calderihabitans maritimus]GAW93373.1 hypothetical protein KKC1_25090 [Calderihabitans maritimus]